METTHAVIALGKGGREVDWKSKKTPLMGVIGGLGVVAFLGGPVAGFYSTGVAVFLAFAIWIVGATVINVLID